MAKTNNFDEDNDELLTVEENCAADKHSRMGGWNVGNLHYNWIVTRQLVGHQLRHSLTAGVVYISVSRTNVHQGTKNHLRAFDLNLTYASPVFSRTNVFPGTKNHLRVLVSI